MEETIGCGGSSGWPPLSGVKRVYGRLTTRGKHAKVAITAVVRKLIFIAYALLRDDQLWIPKFS